MSGPSKIKCVAIHSVTALDMQDKTRVLLFDQLIDCFAAALHRCLNVNSLLVRAHFQGSLESDAWNVVTVAHYGIWV